jgi:hypothetical protein
MKMKMMMISALTLVATTALGHGNVAVQANNAVTAALKTVQRDEPRESLRRFKSISAEVAGYEKFEVLVGYTDGNTLRYICVEDESVEPVVWGCLKQNE